MSSSFSKFHAANRQAISVGGAAMGSFSGTLSSGKAFYCPRAIDTSSIQAIKVAASIAWVHVANSLYNYPIGGLAEDRRSKVSIPSGMRGLWDTHDEGLYRRGVLDDIAAPQRAKDHSAAAALRALRPGPNNHAAKPVACHWLDGSCLSSDGLLQDASTACRWRRAYPFGSCFS